MTWRWVMAVVVGLWVSPWTSAQVVVLEATEQIAGSLAISVQAPGGFRLDAGMVTVNTAEQAVQKVRLGTSRRGLFEPEVSCVLLATARLSGRDLRAGETFFIEQVRVVHVTIPSGQLGVIREYTLRENAQGLLAIRCSSLGAFQDEHMSQAVATAFVLR